MAPSPTDRPNSAADRPAAPTATLARRLHDALVPVLGGLAIDAADLASFGPLGPPIGLLAGGVLGWWLGGVHGLADRGRWIAAGAAAFYCAFPMTEAIPLATIVSAVARFHRTGETAPPAASSGSAGVRPGERR